MYRAIFSLFFALALASVQGTVYSGKGGFALHLDATKHQYVEFDVDLSVNTRLPMTLEAWFMLPEANSSTLRPILARYPSSSGSVTWENSDFILAVNPEGHLIFKMGGGEGLGIDIQSEIQLQDASWYHVGVVVHYENTRAPHPQAVHVYLDGPESEIISAEWSSEDLFRPNFQDWPVFLGKFQPSDSENGYYFHGVIDEVRFWWTERTREEIFNTEDPQNNFALRTITGWPAETWAEDIIASYSFNTLSEGIVFNDVKNMYHGLTFGNPEFIVSELPLFTVAHPQSTVPTSITLSGFDANGRDISFRINYDDLQGSLTTLGGEEINDGDIIVGAKRSAQTSTILFTADSSLTTPTTATFTYTAIAGGDESAPTIVLLEINPCQDAGDQLDDCGICNGNNQAKDACGVCFGDGTSCDGCDGVPNSGLVYDDCGECGGNNECVGCDGIPNSGLIYDACGVCDGNDECLGCDGIPNSGLVYDDCGECGGNGSACAGCDGVPNSGLVYDDCGECGGDGSVCAGCDGVPNSGLVYDDCGECGGSNECLGCDGVPFSGLVLDICGVCGGNNGTCVGCDGSGGGEFDACGVCRGDGSTCGGCDGKGGRYDFCGVCAGDNSTCQCVHYHGYHIEEMDYWLLQWTVNRSIADIDAALGLMRHTLNILEDYDGGIDLAAVVIYLNQFLNLCSNPYVGKVDIMREELDISLGIQYAGLGKEKIYPSK